jgi:plastocyanin
VYLREDSSLTAGPAGAHRRRLLPTALLPTLAALLALTLAACGGGSDDDGGTETTTEAEQPKEPATTSSAAQATTTPGALTATISGTITFGAEAKRAPAVLNMEADPVCAEKNAESPKTEQAFLLDESKGLANVLIQVKSGLPDMEFAAAEPEVTFTQSGCLYDPHVVIIRVGQTVKILNPDGTLHNVHVFGKVNQEFNQAMPKFQEEIERVFDKVEADPFAIKCDVHPWMNAFGVVLDHPYAAVTAADGTFSIPNLPAGTYQVEVWHELLGSQTREVTVAEGGTATLDVALQPPS